MTDTENKWKTLFIGSATKIFNESDEELLKDITDEAGELKDSAFDSILERDRKRVAKFKKEKTEAIDNFHKKNKSEIYSDVEKQIREFFGITEELPVNELLPKVKEKFSAKSKLTSDDIKMHPEYLALETSRVPKEKYEALSNEFEVYKKTIDRKIKFDKVWERAEPLIESFNADWPSDPKIKSNLKALMKKDFESFEDAEFIDNDIILKKDGKRVEDEHLNPIKFPDITKGILTNYVTLKVQDAKGNAGNQNKPGASNVQGYNFANKTEMIDKYNTLTDEAEKKKFLEATRNIRF